MKSLFVVTRGMHLLREMLAKGQYIFTIEDAASSLGFSASPLQLRKLLSKLTKQGWLLRLKRGLYAGTGSLPGKVQIHPFAIATHLIKPSAISHWSAMQHHGLTEQIPRMITAVTTKKVVTPSMRLEKTLPAKHVWEINGIQYEYISIKPEHFFGIEKIWIDEYFQIPVTDKERTLLDSFVSPKMFGGFGEILGILELTLNNIDIKKLVHYTVRYGKKSVAKRLGWSLEYLGVPVKSLRPLLQIPAINFYVLDPTKPAKGIYDKRWMIQNNLLG